MSYSPRWAFLFDKVMLLCRKVTRLGFDVRYSPKQVFTVSTLSVDQVPSTRGGKVVKVEILSSHELLCSPLYFEVFLRLSVGSKRSGGFLGSCQDRRAEISMGRCNQPCQVCVYSFRA